MPMQKHLFRWQIKMLGIKGPCLTPNLSLFWCKYFKMKRSIFCLVIAMVGFASQVHGLSRIRDADLPVSTNVVSVLNRMTIYLLFFNTFSKFGKYENYQCRKHSCPCLYMSLYWATSMDKKKKLNLNIILNLVDA